MFYFEQTKIALIVLNICYIVAILLHKKEKAKKPFMITKRIKRMYITYAILFIIAYALLYIKSNVTMISLMILSILSYFSVMAINILNYPIETLIGKQFYKRAQKKLKDMPDLKIIGITGSYGKTSTKNIIATILSQKYSVLATPESYNTTLGVVRTINEKLEAIHQVFICEMGAKEVGDIKEISDLVKPQYGVLTAVGPQHLETFKNIENVKKTKFELINSLPEDGVAILNYEDDIIKNTEIEKNKISFGLDKDKCDYYADNMNIDETGSNFDIHMKSGTILKASTKLLGELNVINIVGAVALAEILGLTLDEIKMGIKNLKPVEHRLELKQVNQGITIIDDAYNSNIKGAKMALDVLSKFKNKQKVLITPGIVDLGEKLEEYNKNLGKQATKVADFIILVGEKQAEPIKMGLLEEGYSQANIFIAKNLNEALIKMREIVKSDSVVLLENDLPDNYL